MNLLTYLYRKLRSLSKYVRLKLIITILRLLTRLLHRSTPPSPDATIHIPSRDARRTIKAHVYRPATPTPGPSPVLINLHGSGFVFPLHGEDDFFCRYISTHTPYTVFDVAYRLAPEHPFPAAVHDAHDAATWVLAQPSTYDTSRVAICGFSAGANLALVTAACEFPPRTFSSLLAFYPPCDISVYPETKSAPDADPAGRPIPARMARLFNEMYVPGGYPAAKNPRISPAYAELNAVPERVLVVTAARDTLALEAEAVARRLEEAGKKVVCRRMVGCDHGWDKNVVPGSKGEAARDEAYGLAVEMLNG